MLSCNFFCLLVVYYCQTDPTCLHVLLHMKVGAKFPPIKVLEIIHILFICDASIALSSCSASFCSYFLSNTLQQLPFQPFDETVATVAIRRAPEFVHNPFFPHKHVRSSRAKSMNNVMKLICAKPSLITVIGILFVCVAFTRLG